MLSLEERANQGNIEAMNQLGDNIANEAETMNDLLQASQWYERSAQSGSAYGAIKASSTYSILASELQKRRDYINAFKCYVKAMQIANEEMQKHDSYYDLSAKLYDQAIYGKSVVFYLNDQTQDALDSIKDSDQLGLENVTNRNTVFKALCTFTLSNSTYDTEMAAASLFRLCLGQEGYVNQDELGKSDEYEQAIYAITVKLFCKLIADGRINAFNRSGVSAEEYTLLAKSIADRALTDDKAKSILHN